MRQPQHWRSDVSKNRGMILLKRQAPLKNVSCKTRLLPCILDHATFSNFHHTFRFTQFRGGSESTGRSESPSRKTHPLPHQNISTPLASRSFSPLPHPQIHPVWERKMRAFINSIMYDRAHSPLPRNFQPFSSHPTDSPSLGIQGGGLQKAQDSHKFHHTRQSHFRPKFTRCSATLLSYHFRTPLPPMSGYVGSESTDHSYISSHKQSLFPTKM